MADDVYQVIEAVGRSPDSVRQAVRAGVKQAGRSFRNVERFEIADIPSGSVHGSVAHFQVGREVALRSAGAE